jgi:hypothetical protein
MELSRDLPIFSIIQNHIDLLNANETFELEINILKKEGHFSEYDFNNFTNVFRSLSDYTEIITTECLNVTTESDCIQIIGMPYILQYCKSDVYDKNKTVCYKTKTIASDTISDLFDLNICFTLTSKTPSMPPDKWDDMRKSFNIHKDIKYLNKDSITYITSLNKTSSDENYTLKQSNAMKAQQNYCFKIILQAEKNYKDTDVLNAIVRAMQAISLSSMMLTKTQQQAVLDEYHKLVKNDIEVSSYNRNATDPPLLTPKPVTLERINMIDPKEYGAVSILSEYTVTEKADGERILIYCNGL